MEKKKVFGKVNCILKTLGLNVISADNSKYIICANIALFTLEMEGVTLGEMVKNGFRKVCLS